MDTLARALGAMAIIGLLGNAALMWQTQQRLASIEEQQQLLSQQLSTRPTAAVARGGANRRAMRGMGHGGGAPMGGGKAEAGSKVDLGDDEVREQVAELVEQTEQERREQRRQEWEARYQEATVQEVEAFATELGLASDVADAVVDELLAAYEQGAAIRRDIHDDKISLFDGRQQMREVRDASEGRLVEMLGQENYDALEERIGGGRGRW